MSSSAMLTRARQAIVGVEALDGTAHLVGDAVEQLHQQRAHVRASLLLSSNPIA
jgi:hypothetical protein